MVSNRVSDQVDSHLPDLEEERGLSREHIPLSKTSLTRDTKVGVGRVRGSQLEHPEGCG